MNTFSLFIARRYLFSKKSTHAINIISVVSMLGVAVATMALIVTLSVFNGFRDLVAGLFTSFDPQIEITAAKGKSFAAGNELIAKVKTLPQVDVATEIVTDRALAIYRRNQAMVHIMGVEDNFNRLTNINEILYGDGEFSLRAASLDFGILGLRLAETLGASAHFADYMRIYAPRREGQLIDLEDPSQAFVADSLMSPGVIFNVGQAKYDKDYIVTSIDFARRLFAMDGQMTSLALRLKPGSDLAAVKRQVRGILGADFLVKDRYEQQADTFNIMEIEKLIAYIFLSFILLIATFNIISSMAMLIVDKKADTETLIKLGAKVSQLSAIFRHVGRMTAAIGALLGLSLGLLLCWLQQTYGIVALGNSQGNFIIDAYPVSVHPGDILLVFVTVIAISWLSTALIKVKR